MISKTTKEAELHNIIQVIGDFFERDNLIRDNSDVLKNIGIFVLLIGKLEDRIKTIIFIGDPSSRIWGRTFGVAVEVLEKQLSVMKDEYNKNPRDYRFQSFLQGSNIQCFIEQCNQTNKLRNDLIHNFVSPRKSSFENISQILSQVEKMIVGADNWESYKRGRISQEALKARARNDLIADYLHVMTHEGDIRDSLPLDGLVEICAIFYEVLKQLKFR